MKEEKERFCLDNEGHPVYKQTKCSNPARENIEKQRLRKMIGDDDSCDCAFNWFLFCRFYRDIP